MTRLLLAFLLLGCACASAQAQAPYIPRAQLKEPLPEAVEKALADFVELCALEKQAQLSAQMDAVMKAVDGAVKLTPEEKAAMQAPTQAAVAAAVARWKPAGVLALRTWLSRTSEAVARRQIAQWKPSQAGLDEPVEDWTLPQDTAEWQAALKQALGAQRFEVWLQASAKASAQKAKEIQGYVERWVRESRGPLNEDVQAKAGLMKARLELAPDMAAALAKAGEAFVDGITEKERRRGEAMLRSMPDDSWQRVFGRSGCCLRFDRPRGDLLDKLWTEAAAAVLPQNTMARWGEIAKEERRKENAELAELIKPSAAYHRQQMEMAMTLEIEGLTADLALGKERQQRLKKLADQAVEAALKQAQKAWLLQSRGYSAADRKRLQGRVSFGLSDEQQAQAHPVWKEGLKEVLAEDEVQRLEREGEERQQRMLRAVAHACLAELDEAVMFSAEQRARLEPLVAATLEPLLEQRRHQYWSYSTQMLFQYASKIEDQDLRAILDALQMSRWQEAVAAANPQPRTGPLPGGETSPEVPDMEAAISAHLYKMFTAERKKVMAQMMPRVEEAARVLGLPEAAVARLTVAAKGAVEDSLDYWRMNTRRYVTQAAQSATPQNIAQVLAGTERVSFGRSRENLPESMESWTLALRQELTPAQLRRLQAVAKERMTYRLQAMAAMAVGELDRRRRLNSGQCAKLEERLQKLLADYILDLERHMSPSWHLQYYYAMVPAAGIPEQEMQAILNPQQWKFFKERDLPDAMQYWEGIENSHKNRLKQGGDSEDIFKGGWLVE